MAQRLKVLCLHGYMQNAKVFRQRTGALRKGLRNDVDFVYVTAPHAATDFPMMPVDGTLEAQVRQSAVARGAQNELEKQQQQQQPGEQEQEQPGEQEQQPAVADAQDGEELRPAAWWNTMEGDVMPQIQHSTGFLCDVLRDQGPFDGIMGFSQGAAMTALLLGMIMNRNTERIRLKDPGLHAFLAERVPERSACPRFAMLFCGYNPSVLPIERLVAFGTKIPIPNLHVGGHKDAITPMYRGRQLATSFFGAPTIEFHGGGHGIATDNESIQRYHNFMRAAVRPGSKAAGAPTSTDGGVA
ncbi:Ovarian cancer-associated protein 2 [Coemansia helicoidea]|uniref:Ovarian cancer-associated protein 2 n=1 Tax=Coemansia helicoidea TaxID=1286919 RepID=A0ACC1KUC6_9FUNG|nr:Ovarian cancer-associated protein 2 [Coemansia helicoidea]